MGDSVKSRVAQWKRVGPITQRPMDRNHLLLFKYSDLCNMYFIITHYNTYYFKNTCSIFSYNRIEFLGVFGLTLKNPISDITNDYYKI